MFSIGDSSASEMCVCFTCGSQHASREAGVFTCLNLDECKTLSCKNISQVCAGWQLLIVGCNLSDMAHLYTLLTLMFFPGQNYPCKNEILLPVDQ